MLHFAIEREADGGSLFPFGFPTAIDRVPQIDMSAAASFCAADVTQDVLVAFIMRRQAPWPLPLPLPLFLLSPASGESVVRCPARHTHTHTHIDTVYTCVCVSPFICVLPSVFGDNFRLLLLFPSSLFFTHYCLLHLLLLCQTNLLPLLWGVAHPPLVLSRPV